ncbi:Rrf2 family transcriptional regulator [Amaricoccus sp.]|uniref:RrF2 family transcriptional regulator n=1 Tax=Amaricoccus sp. TaxID=1872485 RepID=UPI001B3DD82F|nr:Rrf2 family transcriptional regulator [Amaricoccus sp.]MBP7002770.1 Rrf2 family transcriptional regulator [Amaricoccus sp.]
MRLTQFTDYALRMMMYAAAHGDRLVTIEEVAEAYGISRTHLMKVANLLSRSGFLTSVRGRSGGLRIARPVQEIRLGDIVRATEPDFAIVECFGSDNRCRITARCRLRGILAGAMFAFLKELDAHSLHDLALRPADFGMAPVAGGA